MQVRTSVPYRKSMLWSTVSSFRRTESVSKGGSLGPNFVLCRRVLSLKATLTQLTSRAPKVLDNSHSLDIIESAVMIKARRFSFVIRGGVTA